MCARTIPTSAAGTDCTRVAVFVLVLMMLFLAAVYIPMTRKIDGRKAPSERITHDKAVSPGDAAEFPSTAEDERVACGETRELLGADASTAIKRAKATTATLVAPAVATVVLSTVLTNRYFTTTTVNVNKNNKKMQKGGKAQKHKICAFQRTL